DERRAPLPVRGGHGRRAVPSRCLPGGRRESRYGACRDADPRTRADRHARAGHRARWAPRRRAAADRWVPRGSGAATDGNGMIRVVLADDQALIRSGIRALLDAEDDIEVVAEAGDGGAALERTREVRPDVVLMDVQMPGTDGIEATRQIV